LWTDDNVRHEERAGTIFRNQFHVQPSPEPADSAMPHFACDCPTGSLQHNNSRFVNREFQRVGFLRRMLRAMRGSDWIPLS
jgi:hypothetical protein